MNVPRIIKAMEHIDEKHLNDVENYSSKARSKVFFKNYFKYSAIAACLIVVFVAGVLTANRFKQIPTSDENEIDEHITLPIEDAYEYEPFGQYIPTVIPAGYSFKGTIGVYGDRVMSFEIRNSKEKSTITIIIADPEYFGNSVELNEIIPAGSGTGYYFDGGEYIVYYSSLGDFNELSGFESMVNSSKYAINIER